MDKMKLVYWDVHGLVEPIRLLLRYTETQFEDVRLQFGEGSSVAALKEPFRKNKHTLKLPFPNLPILEHGQFRLTQSQAILKYVARLFGLRAPGNNNAALALEDMLECQIIDIRNRLKTPLTRQYPSEEAWQKEVTAIKEQFVEYFTQLENLLSTDDRKWLTGDRLSYVDFMAYEYIDWYRALLNEETLFDNGVTKYPKLGQFMTRFEQLEPLKEYLASDAYRYGILLSPSHRITSRQKRGNFKK